MRRYIDFLTPLGVLIVVVALCMMKWSRLPGKFWYYVLAAVVLALTHVVLRGADISRALGPRQLKYATDALLFVSAVVVGLGIANYLVYRHNKSWDLTKAQMHSLAEQTKKVLTGLKDDVTITYFAPPTEIGQDARDRLKSYQEASAKVKYQFVDPMADPDKTERYNARGPYPMIFIERGARQEKVSSHGEQDLTNAIVKVTREGARKVCFVEGDGERSLDESGPFGLTSAKSALEKTSYEIEKLALLRKPEVPATCALVVVAGPKKDLDPPVVDALKAYVKKGGKLMVMVEPDPKNNVPNVIGLLKEWNIEVGDNVLLEFSPIGQIVGVGAGPLTPVVVQYPYHEITKEMQGLATVFHTARSVKAGTGSAEGVMSQNLAETSPDSWGETNMDFTKEPTFDAAKDTRGPLPLAAVATVRSTATPPAADDKKDEPKKEPEGRVVAFGDVDFATNQLLGVKWNQDFFLNSVAWLSQDSDLISIRPKDPDNHRVTMSPIERKVIGLGTIFGMPLFFAAAGIVGWFYRRG
jgi:ABC-type uncharacterized transport system involved in gliding motility auxiliary subunit